MNYRKDITGIRAVAVLLVILYHCGFAERVPGGFVGVDVFFVLSGYLITKILYDEARTGSFSIWSFYERRIRRIFPALIVMYLFVLVMSFFTLMPNDLGQQVKNISSSIAFVSNIYFYSKADYFDASSEFNALLHTWSLSVEEQFYIFFPPIFFAVFRKFPRAMPLVLVGATLVSLAFSEVRVYSNPSAVFYFAYYRAWELMVGSILAIGAIPCTSNRAAINVVAFVGLSMILMSAIMLNARSVFPGISALPVCVGTAMIIWSGTKRETIVGRILSIRPAEFVGDISYSLYLWHWPIWVIGGQLYQPSTLATKLAYIGVTFVFAYASYRFVEQPFRKKQATISSRKAVLFGSVSMASAAVVSLSAVFASSPIWGVTDKVNTVADFINYRGNPSFRAGECFLTTTYNELRMFDFDTCLKTSDVKPNYLLLGDSHAAHFYPGFAHFVEINVLQATASSCKPIDGGQGMPYCTSLFKYITDDYIVKHKIDAVIISANWKEEDLPALKREIDKIKKHVPKVFVLGPIAEYDMALPRILAASLYRGDPTMVGLHELPAQRKLDSIMEAEIQSSGASYLSAYKAICPANRCTLWTADDNPIQFDYGHLTEAGSIEITARMRDKILAKLAVNR